MKPCLSCKEPMPYYLWKRGKCVNPKCERYTLVDLAPTNAETPGEPTPELLDLVNRIECVIECLPESLIEWRRQAEVEGALANLRLIYRDGLRVHLVPLIEAIKREVGR